MSEAIAFDTHRFVKRLTGSGFTEQQAETLADEQITLLNANLATKADIAAIQAGIAAAKTYIAAVKAGMDALRQQTKADIAKVETGMDALRHETRSAIESAKVDLLKWMFAALIAQGSVVVALIKLV